MVKFRKIFAGLVSFIFIFTNIAFAHKPAENIWDARKKSYDVAALPAGMQPFANETPNRSALTQSLMEATPAIQSALKGDSASKFISQKKQSPLVSGLPDTFFANVNIKEAHTGSSKWPVILIEDVHQNLEAQTHISQAISSLGHLPGTQPITVALEGAHGGFKYPLFYKFPDQQIVKEVADSFLESGDISGPAHAGFTSAPAPGTRGLNFVGVDDPAAYRANVAAYKNTKAMKDSTLKEISSLKASVDAQKKSVFTPEMLAFDSTVELHRSGQLPLGVYVKKLIAADQTTSLTLEAFLTAYQMEKSIDFNRVESQRAVVLEKLVKTMGKSDLNSLVEMSLGYQQGNVTFGDYYNHLRSLCKKNGIDLAQTPEFENYVRYVLLADGIKADKLFQDITIAETDMYAALTKNSAQKNLIDESRQLYFAKALVDFSLTSNEWTEYEQHSALLASQLDLKPFEQFYVAAEARSGKMVENFIRADHSNLSVLVAGGFHTLGLTELLNRQKLSYVVVTPKITKVDTDSASAYLSVFDREKTPLENIFAGKKLFVVVDVPGANEPMGPGSTGGGIANQLVGNIVAEAEDPDASHNARVVAERISSERFGDMKTNGDTRITPSTVNGVPLKREASPVKPVHSSAFWVLEGVQVFGNTQVATFCVPLGAVATICFCAATSSCFLHLSASQKRLSRWEARRCF